MSARSYALKTRSNHLERIKKHQQFSELTKGSMIIKLTLETSDLKQFNDNERNWLKGITFL